MGRHLLAAAVVVIDIALLAAGQQGWAVPVYALAAALVVVLRYRSPAAAFGLALVLAALSVSAYVVLLWAAYQAGRSIAARSGTAWVAGMAAGGLTVQLVIRPGDLRTVSALVSANLVFVALPLLAGRYQAQHER